MNPSGPPYPPPDAAYHVEGNPVTLTPSEQSDISQRHHDGPEEPVVARLSSNRSLDIQDAVPSSLGWGIHGAPAGEERFGRTQEDVGRHRELDGEQMSAPGEGRVADAVRRKPGASGSQPDLASDLDRKKREQQPARRAMKERRRHGMISDGDARRGVDTELDKTF